MVFFKVLPSTCLFTTSFKCSEYRSKTYSPAELGIGALMRIRDLFTFYSLFACSPNNILCSWGVFLVPQCHTWLSASQEFFLHLAVLSPAFRELLQCASGPWSDSAQFFSPVLSFHWVPALHKGKPCVPHWGSFSEFLLWPSTFSTLVFHILAFHTFQHLVKASGKELSGECELGWWLGLLGILFQMQFFNSLANFSVL